MTLRADQLIDHARPEVVGYQDASREEGTGPKSNHARMVGPRSGGLQRKGNGKTPTPRPWLRATWKLWRPNEYGYRGVAYAARPFRP